LTMTNHSLSYASEQVWNWHNNGPRLCCNGQTTNDPYWAVRRVSTSIRFPFGSAINMRPSAGRAPCAMCRCRDDSDQIWINANTPPRATSAAPAPRRLCGPVCRLVNEQAVRRASRPSASSTRRSTRLAGVPLRLLLPRHHHRRQHLARQPQPVPRGNGYDLCTAGQPQRRQSHLCALEFAGPVFVDFNYTGPANGGSTSGRKLQLSVQDPDLGCGGSQISGHHFIKTAGSSSESLTISNHDISAMDGQPRGQLISPSGGASPVFHRQANIHTGQERGG